MNRGHSPDSIKSSKEDAESYVIEQNYIHSGYDLQEKILNQLRERRIIVLEK